MLDVVRMDEARNILTEFGKLEVAKLRGSTLPPALVDQVKRLCQLFTAAGDAQRHALISGIEYRSSFVFFGFTREMAAQAVRKRSGELLIDGLLALIIENLRFDARDSLMVLALLVHSTAKLKLEPKSFYSNIVRFAQPPTQKVILDFLDRPPDAQRIELFNARESGEGEEFTYLGL